MRRLAVLLLVASPCLLSAPPVAAKSFSLPSARIEVSVESNGVLLVTEHLTYRFDGSLSGGYREVPLRAGESLVDATVSEGEIRYELGGCTDLGCDSPAGTYGVVDLGGRTRIVWHYRAVDEERTFVVRYRLVGVAKAYEDVVDVELKVWGDEWDEPLGHLESSMSVPAGPSPGDIRVWGHPAGVSGIKSLGPDDVSPRLEAFDVPAGQFVEVRVVFPRRLLVSTSGATELAGVGLPDILAEEEREAARANRDRAMMTSLAWLLGLLAFLPGSVAALYLYFRYGREPKVPYERIYEQEPPSKDSPASVQALLLQGRVDEQGFTATLFDLIRRGFLKATPLQVERSTWMGLLNEQISDLELALTGKQESLTPDEAAVLSVIERVLDSGPRPLHEFRTLVREDAALNAAAYKLFREEAVRNITRSRLLDVSGRRGVAVAVGILVGVVFLGFFSLSQLAESRFSAVLVPGVVGVLVVNGLILGEFAASRRAWQRRTREGALLAARWEAFRRYLRDFSRLEEAPPISLALWDDFLVYAIALGVAEEVLEAARLRAPEKLQAVSGIYWYGHHGYTGGSTENAFTGLNSALRGAFSPPSSGGGGGGGFSGGSGGGGGGGGGGAW